jgi:hypothetical protein
MPPHPCILRRGCQHLFKATNGKVDSSVRWLASQAPQCLHAACLPVWRERPLRCIPVVACGAVRPLHSIILLIFGVALNDIARDRLRHRDGLLVTAPTVEVRDGRREKRL